MASPMKSKVSTDNVGRRVKKPEKSKKILADGI
jgi:hypothetical protein